MTTRRRHTTCLMAAALTVGLLATSLSSATAQAAPQPLTRAAFVTYLQRVRTLDGGCLSLHGLLAHPFPAVTPLWDRNHYVAPPRVRPLVKRLGEDCTDMYYWRDVPEPVGADDALGFEHDFLGEARGYMYSVWACAQALAVGNAPGANSHRLVALSDYRLYMQSLTTLARRYHVTLQPW